MKRCQFHDKVPTTMQVDVMMENGAMQQDNSITTSLCRLIHSLL